MALTAQVRRVGLFVLFLTLGKRAVAHRDFLFEPRVGAFGRGQAVAPGGGDAGFGGAEVTEQAGDAARLELVPSRVMARDGRLQVDKQGWRVADVESNKIMQQLFIALPTGQQRLTFEMPACALRPAGAD